ncbi:zinc-ribbon domain-containing protein [Guptibacillus hwajinpoensis]|uniref:zinc-ribbon domain-containing protein n=1 Tax=Guptibacillus hwajinpoensis TaxID=208199 RepID=UPI001CFE192D|nr:zinc-ribbon domain-containing protein [Pseudalkalibacillus hwajinpoensis]
MYCSNCGASNEENSKFCGGCGGQLGGSHSNEATPQQVTQQMTAATVAAEPTNNEYIEKGKLISKNFFSFAIQAFKGPMSASHNVTESDKVNGIIAHLLFAFLLPFFSYVTAKNVAPDGLYDFPITIPFGSFVIQPFLYILIFMAVFIAVNTGVAKLMRVNLSFMNVMTRLGVLIVIPTAAFVVAVLFAALSANVISLLFFFIGTSLFTVSSTSLVFSLKQKSTGGLDVYYGLIITTVLMGIFYAIVIAVVVEKFTDQISNLMLWGL